jgi:hypothetical protein
MDFGEYVGASSGNQKFDADDYRPVATSSITEAMRRHVTFVTLVSLLLWKNDEVIHHARCFWCLGSEFYDSSELFLLVVSLIARIEATADQFFLSVARRTTPW